MLFLQLSDKYIENVMFSEDICFSVLLGGCFHFDGPINKLFHYHLNAPIIRTNNRQTTVFLQNWGLLFHSKNKNSHSLL